MHDVALIVEHGFPMVRVVRVGNNYWTVEGRARGLGDLDGPGHSQEGVFFQVEPWPMRRVAYHVVEWLEWLGCDCAVLIDCLDAIFQE